MQVYCFPKNLEELPQAWRVPESYTDSPAIPHHLVTEQPFVPLCRPILNSSHFRFTFLTFIAFCCLFNCSSVKECVFMMLFLLVPLNAFSWGHVYWIRNVVKKDQAHSRWMHLCLPAKQTGTEIKCTVSWQWACLLTSGGVYLTATASSFLGYVFFWKDK